MSLRPQNLENPIELPPRRARAGWFSVLATLAALGPLRVEAGAEAGVEQRDGTWAEESEVITTGPAASPSFFEELLREGLLSARERALSLARSSRELWAREFEERVLRVGTPLAAGLPPGRLAQRIEERSSDRELLARELGAAEAAGPRALSHQAWALEWLAAELELTSDDRRWMAAAHVAELFELYDLAPAISTGLALERSPWVRAKSRSVLRALCRRDFEDPGSFHAFWVEHGGGPADRFFLEALDASERERLRILERWLADAPHAALDYLADPDRETRRRAARIVSTAIAAGDLQPEVGISALLKQLAGEYDAQVFCEFADDVLEPLLGEPASAEPVRELRAILASAVDGRMPGVEVTVARALSRIPWSEDSASPGAGAAAESEELDSIGEGFGLLAQLVGQLPTQGPFHDSDVSLAVLHAIEGLGRRFAASSGAERELGSSPGRESQARQALRLARTTLGDWVANEQLEVGERIAAVKALKPLANLGDLQLLLTSFRSTDLTLDLRFALLGSIGSLASELAVDDMARLELVREIEPVLAEADPDLRGLALQILAQPQMAAVAGRQGLDLWVQRLGVERTPELRSILLQLVRQHGGAYDVRALLELARFDELYRADPGQAAALGAALSELSAGSTRLSIDAARRLCSDPDPATADARRRSAIGMVARISDEDAAALEPEVHGEIVEWAFELCLARRGLRIAGSDGLPFLARLVDVHLPASDAGAERSPHALHVMAVLSAEYAAAAARAGPEAASEVADSGAPAELVKNAEAAFALALESAPDELLWLTERAHYRDRWGDVVRAREDYLIVARGNGLLAGGEQRSENANANVNATFLVLADLRRAAELCVDPEAGEAEVEAGFALTWALIHDPRWTDELLEPRFEDLRALAERARASARVEQLEQVAALFDEPLSTEQREANGQPQAAAPPWFHGLVDRSGLTPELQALRDQVTAWRAEIAEPQPPTDHPTSDPTRAPNPAARTAQDAASSSGAP